MQISEKAKARFCKDCNIPINIFKDPYFQERLQLLDPFYDTLTKWRMFVFELSQYKNEQDYFEEYNRIKEAAINFIKDSEAYQEFNKEDMSKYVIIHDNLPDKDIFKSSNDGKTFISIDMKKANFSSLKYYDSNIFQTKSWEDFMRKFTNNEHIIKSKYIRQVILGNCNPKKHITYEKYLMDNILFKLKDTLCLHKVENNVAFFSNDEIVLDVTNLSKDEQLLLTDRLESHTSKFAIPLTVELFSLHKIYGTDGFYKNIWHDINKTKIEFKCLNSELLPFVIRQFKGEEIQNSDKLFYHEGLLSQYIEVPEITFQLPDKEIDNNFEFEL